MRKIIVGLVAVVGFVVASCTSSDDAGGSSDPAEAFTIALEASAVARPSPLPTGTGTVPKLMPAPMTAPIRPGDSVVLTTQLAGGAVGALNFWFGGSKYFHFSVDDKSPDAKSVLTTKLRENACASLAKTCHPITQSTQAELPDGSLTVPVTSSLVLDCSGGAGCTGATTSSPVGAGCDNYCTRQRVMDTACGHPTTPANAADCLADCTLLRSHAKSECAPQIDAFLACLGQLAKTATACADLQHGCSAEGDAMFKCDSTIGQECSSDADCKTTPNHPTCIANVCDCVVGCDPSEGAAACGGQYTCQPIPVGGGCCAGSASANPDPSPGPYPCLCGYAPWQTTDNALTKCGPHSCLSRNEVCCPSPEGFEIDGMCSSDWYSLCQTHGGRCPVNSVCSN